MRKPVVITSLQEDLEEIGLLPRVESRPEASRPVGRLEEDLAEEVPARPRSARRVGRLLEDVEDLVDEVHSREDREAVKGFANVAVISATLAERFEGFGKDLGEPTLRRVGQVMEELASDSADVAIELEEQGPVEDPEINRLFKMFMAKLLDALQLYNDITAGPNEMKAPVGEMDDDDELDEMDDEFVDVDDDEDFGEEVSRAEERLESVKARLAARRASGKKGQRRLTELRRRGRRS